MNSNKCRLCNSKLFTHPILQLRGMPKAAQHFPNKNENISITNAQLSALSLSDLQKKQHSITKVEAKIKGNSTVRILHTHLATILPRYFRAMWLILQGLS